MAAVKTCIKCSVEKPIDQYFRNMKCVDGHEHRCKECRTQPPTVLVVRTHKLCSVCKVEKPIGEFPNTKASKDGKKSSCKICNCASSKAWAEKHPEKAKAWRKRWQAEYPVEWARCQRNTTLKRKFGITVEEYEQMIDAQGGRCAICDGSEPKGRGNWHVDHCHKSGKIRGLLCSECNFGLGKFKDDVQLLASALTYLEHYVEAD